MDLEKQKNKILKIIDEEEERHMGDDEIYCVVDFDRIRKEVNKLK